MSLQQIEKSGWLPFFRTLTQNLEGKQAQVEVASLAIGDQILAEGVAFYGIAYDPKGDQIEIALEGIDHLVAHPKEVRIDNDVGGLVSIEIVEQDGTCEIVTLKDPLMLPSA